MMDSRLGARPRAAGRIVAVPLPARAASLLIVIIVSVDGTIDSIYSTTEHQWTRGLGRRLGAGSAFGTLRPSQHSVAFCITYI